MRTAELFEPEKAPTILDVFVPGNALPAGSKRAFPLRGKAGSKMHVSVTDSNPKAKDWKAVVSMYASQRWAGQPLLDGALAVEFDFVRPRPKGHYRTGKHENELRSDAPRHPTGRPDVLKLSRAVEDALTGVVWTDDSLIVHEVLRKKYGPAPGVHIRVMEAP